MNRLKCSLKNILIPFKDHINIEAQAVIPHKDDLTDYKITPKGMVQSVSYQPGGFWSPVPYAVIQKNQYYRESRNTLEQYLVITEEKCKCYNIWNQIYTEDMLDKEVTEETENENNWINRWNELGKYSYILSDCK